MKNTLLSFYDNEEKCRQFFNILINEKYVKLYQEEFNKCKNDDEKKSVSLKYLKYINECFGKNAKFLFCLHCAEIDNKNKVKVLMQEYPELKNEEELLNDFFANQISYRESVSFETNYPSNCTQIEWNEDIVSRCVKKCTCAENENTNRYFFRILSIIGDVEYVIWKVKKCETKGQKRAINIFEKEYPGDYEWEDKKYYVIEIGKSMPFGLKLYDESGHRSGAYVRKHLGIIVELL